MPGKKISAKLLLGLTDNTAQLLEIIQKRFGQGSCPATKAESIRMLIEMYGQFMLTYPDDFSYQTVLERTKIEYEQKFEEMKYMPKTIEESIVKAMQENPEYLHQIVQAEVDARVAEKKPSFAELSPLERLENQRQEYEKMLPMMEGEKKKKSPFTIEEGVKWVMTLKDHPEDLKLIQQVVRAADIGTDPGNLTTVQQKTIQAPIKKKVEEEIPNVFMPTLDEED